MSLLALFVVYLAVRLFWYAVGHVRPIGDSAFLEGLFKLLVWVGPCVVVTMIWALASLHDAWRQLGLHGPVARGFTFGLIATIPMALAAIVSGPRLPDLDDLVGSVLLGPFAEEVLFRGFLFTVLWRRARWPWPVALAISSIAFGLAHMTSFYVRGALALGGALFGWVYYRWGNLWPAIGLHACMNLWWDLSRGVDNRVMFELDAAGIAQALAMVLAVALTLRAGSPRTQMEGRALARPPKAG